MNQVLPHSAADFYRDSGQALLDEQNYPPAIRRHLRSERALTARYVRRFGFDLVVEVGCADGGLHLETLLGLPVDYLGIDLIPEAVGRLNARLRQRFPGYRFPRAVALDVCKLAALANDLRGRRALVMFPFNAFGNLDRPGAALAEIGRLGLDVLLFTYRTDPASTAVRRDYYARCNYTDLACLRTTRGVLFRAAEGLHSYAYHAGLLLRALARHGFRPGTRAFGDAGLCCWGKAPRKED